MAPSTYWSGATSATRWIARSSTGVHIDATGEVLTPEGIEIGPVQHSLGSHQIAVNDQTVLYTWRDWNGGRAAYKRTQAPGGALSEPEVWLTEYDGTTGAISNGTGFSSSVSRCVVARDEDSVAIQTRVARCFRLGQDAQHPVVFCSCGDSTERPRFELD